MKIIFQSFVLLLLFSMCNDGRTQTVELTERVFPGEYWQSVKPENVGFSSKKLDKAKEQFDETGGIAALVVVNGYIIADWGKTDENIDCRSIRKSLINSLFGIYIEDNKIDINKRLSELDVNDGNQLSEDELATQVKYLMSSSSGIYLPAAFEEPSHWIKPKRGSKQPGEYFLYNNWDFNVLSTIFNEQTGSDLFEEFDEKIAKPLEMQHFNSMRNTAYLHQPQLSEHPAYVIRISSKDLARYGWLYLNEGNWNGEQIVPADWVRQSTTTQIKTGENFYYDYGYLWWVSKQPREGGETPFLARGAQSQYVYIDPKYNLVIVFRDNPDSMDKVSKYEAYSLIGAVYASLLY